MGARVFLFHTSAFALYLYVMYFLHVENVKKTMISTDKTVKTMAIFSRRFLTNWTYAIQEVYFFMCLLQHLLCLISAQKMKDKLMKYSDYLFTSIATPMALMVSIVFWVIYLIDRELIFPKALDEVIPVWVNHCIHTFNSLLAIIDMFLVNHKFPSLRNAVKGTLGYLLIYSVCIFGTYFQTGVWIYPLLKELDWPQRFIFTILVIVVGCSMFGLTKLLHIIIWGNQEPVKPKKNTKSKKKQ